MTKNVKARSNELKKMVEQGSQDGRSWAEAIMKDGRTALVNINKLVLALRAFDPSLCRQTPEGEDWDMERVWAQADKLHEPQPGLNWAVLGIPGETVQVYDDLLEAAEECDLDRNIIVACKVEEEKLHLRLDGKWVSLPAYQVPEEEPPVA